MAKKKKFYSQANGMIDAASVPKEFINKQWPSSSYRNYGMIDDTMKEIDKQVKSDLRFKVPMDEERF